MDFVSSALSFASATQTTYEQYQQQQGQRQEQQQQQQQQQQKTEIGKAPKQFLHDLNFPDVPKDQPYEQEHQEQEQEQQQEKKEPIEPPLTLPFLSQMCSEYANYLSHSEVISQQTSSIAEDTIENTLLTSLDSFGTIVDSLRGETSKTVLSLLPALLEQTKQLERVFALIDKLQAYVTTVGNTVTVLEERFNNTEASYNAIARARALRNSPFPLSSIPGLTQTEMHPWEMVAIPSANEFFSAFKSDAFDLPSASTTASPTTVTTITSSSTTVSTITPSTIQSTPLSRPSLATETNSPTTLLKNLLNF